MRVRSILGVIVGLLVGLASAPMAHAGWFGGQQTGTCNPTPCNQTVNFHGAGSGLTLFGDTNPAPVYQVTASSLDGVILHGSGSSIDSGPGGPGLSAFSLAPASPWAWTYIDFMLDSVLHHDVLPSTAGLTIKVYDQFGGTHSFSALFPYETGNGENQHYYAEATDGDLITRVDILYTDPNCPQSGDCVANRINDIHNIDVASALNTPEPAGLAVLGVGLAGFNLLRRCRGRNRRE